MAVYEPIFNLALAQALRGANPDWSDEGRQAVFVEDKDVLEARGKRPDILVRDPAPLPPVAIEVEIGGRPDGDAIARLGAVTTLDAEPIGTAIGVRAPGDFPAADYDTAFRALRGGAVVEYALFQQEGDGHVRFPKRGFVRGTAGNIADLASAAAQPAERIEKATNRIVVDLRRAANVIRESAGEERIGGFQERMFRRSAVSFASTTAMLWFNALLTQHRLARWGGGIPDLPFSDPGSLRFECVVGAWRRVLESNWSAVFEPSIELLRSLGDRDPYRINSVLAMLAGAVGAVAGARIGHHVNIAGELFQRIVDDRKESAAFYTRAPAAEMLAALAIRPEQPVEWGDPGFFRKHALADLACGTGSLLRAGYLRAEALHRKTPGATRATLAELHKHAMEAGVVGADISPIAAHMTSSSLAAAGQGEPYDDTQIAFLAVGAIGGKGSGGQARTGSLELLDANVDTVTDLFGASVAKSTGGRRRADSHSVTVSDASLRWVIMNPPYSRTRRGQSAFDVAGLTDSERKACQARWGKLLKNSPANGQAGMAASFLYLARRKIRPGGAIGFVLPLTAAFAESWTGMRRMIENDFRDIIAVSTLAGSGTWSDDTGMEEMLLVATRKDRQDGGAVSPILCVTLSGMPDRVGIAGEYANAVRGACAEAAAGPLPIRLGDDRIGNVLPFAPDDGAPWSNVGIGADGLAYAAIDMGRGKLSHPARAGRGGIADWPMTTVGELFAVGPSHHRIGHPAGGDGRGAFRFDPLDAQDAMGPDRALWSASAARQRRLVVAPTHRGGAPKGVGSDAERTAMRDHVGTLFYARNMRWTSQAVLAATVEYPVMGGRSWTALLHGDDDLRKAFALWANSTPGMLVHWTRGQRTQQGRAPGQIGAMKKMPCPDLAQMPGGRLRAAAAAFDGLASRALLPACQAHRDPVRRDIDAAVLALLAAPPAAADAVAALRALWCGEPSVHGGNAAALAALEKAGIDTAATRCRGRRRRRETGR